VRPRAKFTIDNLQKVVYEESIDTKMNDLDHCLEVVCGHVASHSPLNISETVRDGGLVPKDHQQEMASVESNGHVTDDVTRPWKVKVVTQIRLQPNLENSWRCYLVTAANYSDSLTCCYNF